MFGSPFTRNNSSITSPPSQFRDSARNAIYQQLPSVITSSSAGSIRSAPSQFNNSSKQHHSTSSSYSQSHRSSASSVFSSGKRSVRSAPSIYSSSTATIPEDSEPISITVEQFVNDIALHENHFYQQHQLKLQQGIGFDNDDDELHKISLGSELQYQNNAESLIDWNLNVTRCKLILTQLPMVSQTPDFQYSSNTLPQLVGDLSHLCHIVLIQPHITDKELIYTLLSSNIYQEHNLDVNFKKSVAEISVKQSRLLQINSPKKPMSSPITPADNQLYLRFKFKEIAIRNYLINLAAAATTAYEYKIRSDTLKKSFKSDPTLKRRLTKEEKKMLWEEVRSDVFKRAGLEE